MFFWNFSFSHWPQAQTSTRLCLRQCRCLWKPRISAWSTRALSQWSSWCLMEIPQWVRMFTNKLYKLPYSLHWTIPISLQTSVNRLAFVFYSLFFFISDVGEIKLSTIQKNIKRVMRPDFSLFSLGIGFDVDFDFLERIALENRGMAQRIYANHDASEQLKVPRPTFYMFPCFICVRECIILYLYSNCKRLLQ